MHDSFSLSDSFVLGIRHIKQRKNINKNTSMIVCGDAFQFKLCAPCCVTAPQFGMRGLFLCLSIVALEKIGTLKELRRLLHQDLIIVPKHYDIYIIIPWDKAFMANCAQQRTSVSKIPEVILLAKIIKFL